MQWQELNSGKPDDDYEDPEEVAAIHEAKENTGDFKLKSADDFVVPDHLRMNTEKALTKLLVLNQQVKILYFDYMQLRAGQVQLQRTFFSLHL